MSTQPLLHPSTDIPSFRKELATLIRYSLPTTFTHLLEYSLLTVSVLSIGHLDGDSEIPLAGISLGSMTASVTALSILQGLSSALDTLLPGAWTGADPSMVGIWCWRMGVIMFCTLIPIITIWTSFAQPLLLFLKQDPEVARLASEYLWWMSWGLPAYAFNAIIRRYFQAQGLFSIPTKIILLIAPINAALNYLLVFSPTFSLGFKGAPIAIAISFNLISIFSLYHLLFIVPRTAYSPPSRLALTNLKTVIKLGFGGVAMTASEWWAWELVALLASLLGPVELATQSVLLVSASTTFQGPFAIGVASSVRIGNLLGAALPHHARTACHASLTLSIIYSLFTSTLFLSFHSTWGTLFTSNRPVIELVSQILPLVALFQFVDALSAVSGGIMRARGLQITGALLNLSAYYIIGVPFGCLLCFQFGLGLNGLWIGLTIALFYCAIITSVICLKSDWKEEVGRVKERHDVDVKPRVDVETGYGIC